MSRNRNPLPPTYLEPNFSQNQKDKLIGIGLDLAAAIVQNAYGEPDIAAQILGAGNLSLEEIKTMDLTEYDMAAIKEIAEQTNWK